jgi:indole-3-glycerol phosphate synthase
LTDEARARAATLRQSFSRIEAAARAAGSPPSFSQALSRNDVAVIAEVKRSSPSKGVINESLDLGGQVSAYQAGGAAAISILTEQTRFGGSNEDLIQARRYVGLPLLKKDFHVDTVQILEARALGAAAALVIARAVEPSLLNDLVSAGADCGLEVLVEVRDEQELSRALAANARLIGVNNRNLETLEIDPDTCSRILPLIPKDVVAVAESGINSPADVERLAALGADAVLVGSVLSAATNPEAAVRALTGVPRSGGARKG